MKGYTIYYNKTKRSRKVYEIYVNNVKEMFKEITNMKKKDSVILNIFEHKTNHYMIKRGM